MKTLFQLMPQNNLIPYLESGLFSWITAILQLNSKVTDILGNVIAKLINIRVKIRLFSLLARCNYILHHPRSSNK